MYWDFLYWDQKMNAKLLVEFINSDATRKDKLICVFKFVYGSVENGDFDAIKTLLHDFDPCSVEPIFSTAVLRSTYRFNFEMPSEWLEFHEKVKSAVMEKDPDNFRTWMMGLIPARIYSC
jgi:hypothetical protein